MNAEWLADIRLAAQQMDWDQVVANGGPPCFYLHATARFCGRAERWHGHGVSHEFLSLRDLIDSVSRARPAVLEET